jgi:hypothetical protein
VDRASRDPILAEMPGDPVGASFRSRENDCPGHSGIGEKFNEEITLAACFDKQDLLAYPAGGFRLRSYGNLGRIDKKAACELLNFGWHCRREKEILPLLRKRAGDSPDRLYEAEVEHAISLVKHKDFGLVKARSAAIQVVFETARGRDQNVEAARKRFDLPPMRDTAEDRGDAEREARAKSAEALGDLACQFARRAQNQDTAAIAGSSALMCCKMMENGKCEGGCLASAGLGYADEVAACQDGRNGLCLDRSRLCVALFAEGMEKRRGETEPGEFSQF